MVAEPSRENIETRKARLREELAKWDQKEKEYRETHQIEFFKPIPPYQTQILEYINTGKKNVTLQGANQIGKTVLGSNVVGSFCLGIQPWDKQETVFGRRPVRGRVLCSDWEKHAATVIVPELRKWLPQGEYTTKKNNLGIEHVFEFSTGSSLELITNKQATADHEGWKGDFVWADEPPQHEKYVANKRGLVAANGLFLLTMTAVTESWVLDEIIRNADPSYASVTNIPIRANPYLLPDAIQSFESSLREVEKIARIQGGWLNLVGLVWPGFKLEYAPTGHLIKAFKIPTDWPVVAMIDFHLREPQAISFYAFDRQGRVYVIHEIWKKHTAEETADEIIRAKSFNAWRLEKAFIDPLSKGDVTYLKQRGIDIPDAYSVIKERLWKHGVELDVASKDKTSGILNIEQWLAGPSGFPVLFFFDDLKQIQEEGHLWEIQRWTYDDNNKPKDVNDHFMENLYRVSLTGMKWQPVRDSNLPFKSETDFQVFEKDYGISDTETEFNVFEAK